jgi:hypothetical protein
MEQVAMSLVTEQRQSARHRKTRHRKTDAEDYRTFGNQARVISVASNKQFTLSA